MNKVDELMMFGDVEESSFKKHTTFRVGGKIETFVHLESIEQAIEAFHYVHKNQKEYKIIGNGSNLLPSDEVYTGIILSMERHCHKIKVKGTTIIADAGASVIAIAYLAMQHGIKGFEFASGIPGTLGGAIFMNAGAYKSDMNAVVQEVYLAFPEGARWVSREEMKFGYRTSRLKYEQAMVLAVRMEGTYGNPRDIMELMQNRKERRLASQPYTSKCAGSTFKNPEGYQAWQLIDQLELRGTRVGGASVSTKHCNFIVNDEDATASDLRDLMMFVQNKVKENFDVDLQLEVELFHWNTKEKMK